jgi:carbon storage regulator
MLVLSRKGGEGVVIAGEIVIRVLSVQGGRVRLGVEAPADITVLRSELTHLELTYSDEQLEHAR